MQQQQLKLASNEEVLPDGSILIRGELRSDGTRRPDRIKRAGFMNESDVQRNKYRTKQSQYREEWENENYLGVSGLTGMMARMYREENEELSREEKANKEKERTRISHHLESLIAHLMDRPPHPEFVATVVNPLRLHPRYDRYRHPTITSSSSLAAAVAAKKRDTVDDHSFSYNHNDNNNNNNNNNQYQQQHHHHHNNNNNNRGYQRRDQLLFNVEKKNNVRMASSIMESDENVDMHLRKDIAKYFLRNIPKTKKLIEERKLRDAIIKYMTDMAHHHNNNNTSNSNPSLITSQNNNSNRFNDNNNNNNNNEQYSSNTQNPNTKNQHTRDKSNEQILTRGRGDFTFGTGKMTFEKHIPPTENQSKQNISNENHEIIKITSQSKRLLRKKLREIEQLEKRVEKGEELKPQQKDKINRKQEVIQQLEKLNTNTPTTDNTTTATTSTTTTTTTTQ